MLVGSPSLAEWPALRPTGFVPTFREAPVELQYCAVHFTARASCWASHPRLSVDPRLRFPACAFHLTRLRHASCKHGRSYGPEMPRASFSLRAWPRFGTVSCLDAAAGLSAPQIHFSDADQNPLGANPPRRLPSANLCGASPGAKQTSMTASSTTRKLINSYLLIYFRNLHV